MILLRDAHKATFITRRVAGADKPARHIVECYADEREAIDRAAALNRGQQLRQGGARYEYFASTWARLL
jgi:hypothetical protein